MKKLLTVLSVVLFASFILSSCEDSSPESEGKKAAELMCESFELSMKAMMGDAEAEAKIEELEEKFIKLETRLEEKWGDDEDAWDKFEDAIEKSLMEDCDAYKEMMGGFNF